MNHIMDIVDLIDSDEEPTKIGDEKASQMCCRICLQSNCRFILLDSNLKVIYEQLTGVSVEHDDGLPQELCVECATLLDKYHKFRDKSIKGDFLLRKILQEDKLISKKKREHFRRNIIEKNYNNLGYCPTILHLDIKPTILSDNETDYLKIENIIDFDIDDTVDSEQYFAEPLQNEFIENIEKEPDNKIKTRLKKEIQTNTKPPVKKEKTKPKRRIKKEPSKPKITSKKSQSIAAQLAINDALIKEFFHIKELSFEEQMQVAEERREQFRKFPFQCELCYRGFSSQVLLNTHMGWHSPARGKSECKICHIRCAYDRYVRSHVRNVHQYQLSCKRCDFVVSARAVAVTHAEWHNGKRFSCDICGMVFEKKTTLFSHIRILHPSNVVCLYCGYSYINERGLTFHINTVHFNEKQIELSGPWCSECNIQFYNEDALVVHNQIKHIAANKPVRNTSAIRQRKLSRELERDKRATDRDTKHELERESRQPSVRNARQMSRANGYGHFMKEPTPCEICGVLVNSWTEYRTHFAKSHKNMRRTLYANPYHSDLMCHLCGKLFKFNVGLKEHLETHSDERPYKCEVCHKCFKTDTRLKLHQNVHIGRSYTCPICGKGFNQRGNRDRHITYTHSDEKRFKCESCEKCFKTNCERKLHIKHIHLKEPWPKRHRNRHKLSANIQEASVT